MCNLPMHVSKLQTLPFLLFLLVECFLTIHALATPPVLNNSSVRGGFTGDKCSVQTDCEEPRTCFEVPLPEDLVFDQDGLRLENGLNPCTNVSMSCRCFPKVSKACSSSRNCVINERCIGFEAQGTAYGLCVSCDEAEFMKDLLPIENVDDGSATCISRDNCISIYSLSHLSSHQLVYRKHRYASVLCDEFSNCATPGHFVAFQGSSMMMKSYCSKYAVKGCMKRSMYVNSPRMRLGLRLRSYSLDLEFLALATKYETSIEEKALQVLIKTGLL